MIEWYRLPVLTDDGRWETPEPPTAPEPSLLTSVPDVAPNSAMDAAEAVAVVARPRRRASRARAAVSLLVVITLAGVGLAGAIGVAVGILAFVLKRAAG